MSSNPCVGCAWRPSPALITCTCEATWFAIRWAAPLEECRTTNMSAYIAERLSTVSSMVSPLVEDDTVMFRLMTSAERRFAAISNVVRVRVEGSKNRLNTLLPRSNDTFFTSRSVTPTKDSAVSRICTSTSRGRPSMDSRCCSSPLALSWGLRCTLGLECKGQPVAGVALQPQAHAGGHLDARAAVLGADRQLPAAAVGEDHQRNARRAAVVEQLVHRRAHRAAGVKHVIDQQQIPAVDVERNLGALRVVMQPAGVIVVAVERDVHQAQRLGQPQHRVQPLREPGAARIEADHGGLRADPRLELADQLHAQLLGFRQLHESIAR